MGPALSRDEIEELRSAPIAPRDVGVLRYVTKVTNIVSVCTQR
jgi:hypothetical protein